MVDFTEIKRRREREDKEKKQANSTGNVKDDKDQESYDDVSASSSKHGTEKSKQQSRKDRYDPNIGNKPIDHSYDGPPRGVAAGLKIPQPHWAGRTKPYDPMDLAKLEELRVRSQLREALVAAKDADSVDLTDNETSTMEKVTIVVVKKWLELLKQDLAKRCDAGAEVGEVDPEIMEKVMKKEITLHDPRVLKWVLAMLRTQQPCKDVQKKLINSLFKEQQALSSSSTDATMFDKRDTDHNSVAQHSSVATLVDEFLLEAFEILVVYSDEASVQGHEEVERFTNLIFGKLLPSDFVRVTEAVVELINSFQTDSVKEVQDNLKEVRKFAAELEMKWSPESYQGLCKSMEPLEAAAKNLPGQKSLLDFLNRIMRDADTWKNGLSEGTRALMQMRFEDLEDVCNMYVKQMRYATVLKTNLMDDITLDSHFEYDNYVTIIKHLERICKPRITKDLLLKALAPSVATLQRRVKNLNVQPKAEEGPGGDITTAGEHTENEVSNYQTPAPSDLRGVASAISLQNHDSIIAEYQIGTTGGQSGFHRLEKLLANHGIKGLLFLRETKTSVIASVLGTAETQKGLSSLFEKAVALRALIQFFIGGKPWDPMSDMFSISTPSLHNASTSGLQNASIPSTFAKTTSQPKLGSDVVSKKRPVDGNAVSQKSKNKRETDTALENGLQNASIPSILAKTTSQPKLGSDVVSKKRPVDDNTGSQKSKNKRETDTASESGLQNTSNPSTLAMTTSQSKLGSDLDSKKPVDSSAVFQKSNKRETDTASESGLQNTSNPSTLAMTTSQSKLGSDLDSKKPVDSSAVFQKSKKRETDTASESGLQNTSNPSILAKTASQPELGSDLDSKKPVDDSAVSQKSKKRETNTESKSPHSAVQSSRNHGSKDSQTPLSMKKNVMESGGSHPGVDSPRNLRGGVHDDEAQKNTENAIGHSSGMKQESLEKENIEASSSVANKPKKHQLDDSAVSKPPKKVREENMEADNAHVAAKSSTDCGQANLQKPPSMSSTSNALPKTSKIRKYTEMEKKERDHKPYKGVPESTNTSKDRRDGSHHPENRPVVGTRSDSRGTHNTGSRDINSSVAPRRDGPYRPGGKPLSDKGRPHSATYGINGRGSRDREQGSIAPRRHDNRPRDREERRRSASPRRDSQGFGGDRRVSMGDYRDYRYDRPHGYDLPRGYDRPREHDRPHEYDHVRDRQVPGDHYNPPCGRSVVRYDDLDSTETQGPPRESRNTDELKY